MSSHVYHSIQLLLGAQEGLSATIQNIVYKVTVLLPKSVFLIPPTLRAIH